MNREWEALGVHVNYQQCKDREEKKLATKAHLQQHKGSRVAEMPLPHALIIAFTIPQASGCCKVTHADTQVRVRNLRPRRIAFVVGAPSLRTAHQQQRLPHRLCATTGVITGADACSSGLESCMISRIFVCPRDECMVWWVSMPLSQEQVTYQRCGIYMQWYPCTCAIQDGKIYAHVHALRNLHALKKEDVKGWSRRSNLPRQTRSDAKKKRDTHEGLRSPILAVPAIRINFPCNIVRRMRLAVRKASIGSPVSRQAPQTACNSARINQDGLPAHHSDVIGKGKKSR